MLLYGKRKSSGTALTAETVARCDKVYVNLAEAVKADWDKIDDMSENYEVFVQDAITSLGSYIGISTSKFQISESEMPDRYIPTVYVENSGSDEYYTEYYLYINNTDNPIPISDVEYIGIEEVPVGKAALIMHDNVDDSYRLVKLFNNSETVEIPNVAIEGDIDPTKTEENTELLQYVSNFVSLTPFGYSQCIYGTTENIPQNDDSEVEFITVGGEDITEYLYDKSSKYAIKTDAGKLILVDEDAPDGEEFYGMVDGEIIVGKGPKIVNITFNDVAHMHFELEGDVAPHVGDDVTVLVVPDEGWEVASDGSGSPSISVNGEEVVLEPVIDSYNKYAVATMGSEDVTIALAHAEMREAE